MNHKNKSLSKSENFDAVLSISFNHKRHKMRNQLQGKTAKAYKHIAFLHVLQYTTEQTMGHWRNQRGFESVRGLEKMKRDA